MASRRQVSGLRSQRCAGCEGARSAAVVSRLAVLAQPFLASPLLGLAGLAAAFGLADLSDVAGLSAAFASLLTLACLACLEDLAPSSAPASGGRFEATRVFLPRCLAAACSCTAVSAATAAISAAPVRVGPV